MPLSFGDNAMAEDFINLANMQRTIDYYEGLLDFLEDHVPCLAELVDLYEEEGE